MLGVKPTKTSSHRHLSTNAPFSQHRRRSNKTEAVRVTRKLGELFATLLPGVVGGSVVIEHVVFCLMVSRLVRNQASARRLALNSTEWNERIRVGRCRDSIRVPSFTSR